jgi:hypothetical protein
MAGPAVSGDPPDHFGSCPSRPAPTIASYNGCPSCESSPLMSILTDAASLHTAITFSNQTGKKLACGWLHSLDLGQRQRGQVREIRHD